MTTVLFQRLSTGYAEKRMAAPRDMMPSTGCKGLLSETGAAARPVTPAPSRLLDPDLTPRRD